MNFEFLVSFRNSFNFIYFNNSLLAERYGKNDYATGKEVAKQRKIAVIEDIFLEETDEKIY